MRPAPAGAQTVCAAAVRSKVCPPGGAQNPAVPRPPVPRPPKTEFADFSDIGAAPFIGQTGRAGYQKFSVSPMPRAFAIASNGAWGWAAGGEGALAQALDNCNQRGKGICKLYAVDSDVVWPNSKSSDENH